MKEGSTVRYNLDITLLCMGMPMAGDTIPSGKSLGGSETAAVQASEALAKIGHRVSLFCMTEKQHEANGVEYRPMGWVQSTAGGPQFPKGFFDHARSVPTDVMLVQRQPVMFQFDYPSKCNVLWQHDLATKTGPSNFGGFIWNLDKILVLSEFMKKQYQAVHGGVDALYHVTRNGIDLSLLDSVPDQERDRFKLMFTARPERGLDILLTRVWPEIIKREPRARLYVSRYEDPSTLPLYNELAEAAKQHGDSVQNLGNLGKQELYKHYKQARLFVYSSVFEEVSHITSQELGACGTVMLGPWKGACPETCAGTHVLLKEDGAIGLAGEPVDPGFKAPSDAYIRAFIDQTIDLIHNDQRWEKLSKAARQRAERWTWGPVAEEWTELFHDIIGAKTSDTKRMVKHFLFNSDVLAARQLAARHNDPVLHRAVDKYIDRHVPFMNVSDSEARRQTLAEFYEQRSGGAAADFRTAMWADTEPRCRELVAWLGQHDDVKSVLDYGCAHGGYVRAVSNAHPALGVLGVDVSPSLIRCANELRTSRLADGAPAFLHPEQVAFKVGDETMELEQQFDCVNCMETLEHVPDPCEFVAQVERHCRPGGWMVWTVPTGHIERNEFVMKGNSPCHLTSWDKHDVYEVFGHRKEFSVTHLSSYQELELDRTFGGCFFITYRKDDKPVGKIDYERKLFLQGPRETVAFCLIANNEEATLHRCLRSVTKMADQIVVLDNGPSIDRTTNVALEYTDDVRAGTNPFFCYTHLMQHDPMTIDPATCRMAGFETPRNESIEDVWTDWVLWIDADEQLLDWGGLWKYLRANYLHGYAMPQYHVAVDPAGVLKKDIPVRLFRNGVGIKFYGCLSGDTLISTAKGALAIKDLVGQRPWVYCYDHQKARISIEQANWVGMTRRQVKVLEIELDDGTIIKATPEHLFLLRKAWKDVQPGDYVPASELRPGMRLMPCYRLKDGRSPVNRGWRIAQRGTGMVVDEHRFIYETINGPIPKGYHVHHRDHDPINNDPSNLQLLTAREHALHHNVGRHVSEDTKKRIVDNHAPCDGANNSMWGRRHGSETKALIGAKSRLRGAGQRLNQVWTIERRAELNKKTWADPIVRQKRIEGIRRAARARAANHKIVAIKDGGVEDVYNIEMPAPNHNFVAGGVIVHNCVHEHAEFGINKGVGQGCMLITDVHIHHDGYLTESIRRKRFWRNFKLLQCDRVKYPERILGIFLYDIRDEMHVAKYAMEANGHRVTPDVRPHLENVIRSFRKHFLTNEYAFLSEDALNYYSEALALMGEGTEVCVSMDVKPQGAALNGTCKFRAADKEEARKIIDNLLTAKFFPYEGTYAK